MNRKDMQITVGGDGLPEGRERLKNLPAPKDLKPDCSMKEVIAADIEITNAVVQHIHQAWGWVRTLDEVQSMANTTLSVLAKRRVLLNKQLGAVKEEAVIEDGVLDALE